MNFKSRDYVGTTESITDEMLLLDPTLTPLIDLIGYDTPVTNTTHIWVEDSMFADKYEVVSIRDYDLETETPPNESVVSNEKVTRVSEINVGNAEGIRVDDVLYFDDEQLFVRAVQLDKDTKVGTITVDRGHADTKISEIVAGTTIEYMFSLVAEEGQDAREGRHKKRISQFNHTQIFDESVVITNTALSVSQHGISDLYEREKQKKQQELALHLEKALITGVRYKTPLEDLVDGKNETRMMGGLHHFCDTRVKSEMTYDDYVDIAQELFEMGALNPSNPNYLIMMGQDQKRKINKMDVDKVVLDPESNKRGQIVNAIVTDFGTLPVLMNKNCRPDEIYIIDPSNLSVRPLIGRSWQHQPLAKTGDRTAGMLFGEFTFEVRQPETMIRIKGLSHR